MLVYALPDRELLAVQESSRDRSWINGFNFESKAYIFGKAILISRYI